MALASQVPYGHEGTVALSDVQADRFALRLVRDYLPPEDERRILDVADQIEAARLTAVVSLDDILASRRQVGAVTATPEIRDFIVQIVARIRGDTDVQYGPSHRASITLFRSARAVAFLDGRDFVIPDDVIFVAHPALDHRVWLRPEAAADGVESGAVVERALDSVPVPR
jgi:MoxR-like ATPase